MKVTTKEKNRLNRNKRRKDMHIMLDSIKIVDRRKRRQEWLETKNGRKTRKISTSSFI